MEELKKVQRVIRKLDATAPHETMLVVDAGTGQNALNQAQQFHQAVGISGITVTKLDGTAKGGILFAIAKKLAIPVRFIGVGETLEDLREFDAEEFVSALLAQSDT
jgi:fused signal recognition particle receptor